MTVRSLEKRENHFVTEWLLNEGQALTPETGQNQVYTAPHGKSVAYAILYTLLRASETKGVQLRRRMRCTARSRGWEPSRDVLRATGSTVLTVTAKNEGSEGQVHEKLVEHEAGAVSCSLAGVKGDYMTDARAGS